MMSRLTASAALFAVLSAIVTTASLASADVHQQRAEAAALPVVQLAPVMVTGHRDVLLADAR